MQESESNAFGRPHKSISIIFKHKLATYSSLDKNFGVYIHFLWTLESKSYSLISNEWKI